jgi:hypothetical protein
MQPFRMKFTRLIQRPLPFAVFRLTPAVFAENAGAAPTAKRNPRDAPVVREDPSTTSLASIVKKVPRIVANIFTEGRPEKRKGR